MIFICHASSDKDFAQQLATGLECRGFSVFLDLWDLRVGQSLHAMIGKALKDAALVVVVMSPASVQSRWCMDELNAALSREKAEGCTVVLPVLLTPCDLPAFLSDRLYADFHSDWNRAFSELLASIQMHSQLDADRAQANESPHALGLWSFLGCRPQSLTPDGLRKVIPNILALREQTPFIRGVAVKYSPRYDEVSAREFQEMLSDVGLRCSSLVLDPRTGVSEQPLSPATPEELCRTMGQCRKGIDFAREIGAELVVFWMLFELVTSPLTENLPLREDLLDRSLEIIYKYAAETGGPDICVEANFDRYRGPTLFDSLAALQLSGPRCRTLPRLGHSYGIEVEDMLETGFPRRTWMTSLHTAPIGGTGSVRAYHLRTSPRAFIGLSSLSFAFVQLVHDLASAKFKGPIVHSMMPPRTPQDEERTMKIIGVHLRLYNAAEALQRYLNWGELLEASRGMSLAEMNRVIEKRAEHYGIPM